MSKTILYGEDARTRLKVGVDSVANAVKVTLGARGRTVIIDNPYIPSIVTKDGVTVARNIELADPIENVGAAMVKDVALKVLELSGDGTTTACVLAQAFFDEGRKLVAAGIDPMQLKKGIDNGVEQAVAHLAEISIPVSDKLREVATVSANNDAYIGGLVAEAYSKIGKSGIVTIEKSGSTETEIKLVDGMELNKGFLSPFCVSDITKMSAELKNTLVLIYDRPITTATDLLKIFDVALKKVSGVSLLIICSEMDGEAFATFNVNRMKYQVPAAVIQAPSYGEERRQIIEDIAILTGGTVISEQNGLVLDKLTPSLFGKCDSVTVTKDKCTIVGGKGSKESIDTRMEELLTLASFPGTTEIEKVRLESRIAKLGGGVAILYVGGVSEVEISEKKDRCDDAIRATKAAIDEGIVPGGGYALLSCPITVFGNRDYAAGIEVVKKVLEAPIRQLCENAGIDAGWVVRECKERGLGYNLLTDKFEELISSGIIDPKKVVRIALEQAASVAGTLLTSNVLMVEIPTKESK